MDTGTESSATAFATPSAPATAASTDRSRRARSGRYAVAVCGSLPQGLAVYDTFWSAATTASAPAYRCTGGTPNSSEPTTNANAPISAAAAPVAPMTAAQARRCVARDRRARNADARRDPCRTPRVSRAPVPVRLRRTSGGFGAAVPASPFVAAGFPAADLIATGFIAADRRPSSARCPPSSPPPGHA
ncbi:hypothetical protein EES46_14995 [Streptomyces sp. ADI98-10]|nr:hypothetical protein EES46_14995 [Streptomyces sp. ADI98-10]